MSNNNNIQIKLLVMDVDGVMTDGSIFIDHEGHEIKRFHVRDGLAVRVWHHCGLSTAIITARSSHAVAHRAADLGIQYVEQGAKNKLQAFMDICHRAKIDPDHAAYVGDDLADLAPMTKAGFPIAPADAAPEIRDVARYITTVNGGKGAIRESVEYLLHRINLWDKVLKHYAQ